MVEAASQLRLAAAKPRCLVGCLDTQELLRAPSNQRLRV